MRLTPSAYPIRRLNPGDDPATPFKIFGFPLARALGDFAAQNVIMASIKHCFEHSRLFTFHHDDRPYKSLLIESNWHIDQDFREKDPNLNFPVELFDVQSGGRVHHADPAFEGQHASWPDLVITPSIMQMQVLNALPNIASLHFPDRLVPEMSDRLVSAGVDPDRWFCVMHYRDVGYEQRPASALRDSDPEQFLNIRDLLIDKFGAQVVRVGHPGMTEFPARAGFVDLIGPSIGFDLQAFAITRARFLFCGASGVGSVGSAFNVPTVIVQSPSEVGTWNHHDMHLCQRFYDPSGKRISIHDAVRDGVMAEVVFKELIKNHGYSRINNTLDELREVAGMMVAQTAGVEHWRQPEQVPFTEFPNRISLPLTLDMNPFDNHTQFIEFPE
ncbi:MAG: TIGR04372 family glycosyltransferase [Rhodospirillaceae bacterium]|nr:TIGR04372 family glycosyltransferase [Rhodospirillaceae bacterium]